MQDLVQELSGNRALASFFADPSEPPCREMWKVPGIALLKSGPVWVKPFDQILLVVMQADFAETDQERVSVASILCVPRKTVFPMVTEHRGLELAGRCLISLGLFGHAMEARKQRGYPPPCFYRNVGKSTFAKAGMQEISEHFEKWEWFLGELFQT